MIDKLSREDVINWLKEIKPLLTRFGRQWKFAERAIELLEENRDTPRYDAT